MQISSPVDAVTVDRNLADGTLLLEWASASTRVRPWTWGERRRLLESSFRTEQLDARAFAQGFVKTLCEPVPSYEWWLLVAFVALSAFGDRDPVPTTTFARGELLLAKALGFAPETIDRQPASALDRLLGELSAEYAPTDFVADDGWTHIVVNHE